jgi:hypothetical protein
VVKSLLSPGPDQTTKRLEALVDLARSARQDGIDPVLGKVAETVRSVSGFRTIIFNVHHPAWDDHEGVLVYFSDNGGKMFQVRPELLLGRARVSPGLG